MSEATQLFQQVFSTRLFVMPRGAGDEGWSAYLLAANETPPTEPISISQSFKDFEGSYLFALQAPEFSSEDEVKTFIQAVRNHLNECFAPSGFAGRACLWIPDPTTPAFGTCRGYSFTFQRAFNVTLQTDLNNLIGNQITLSIARGALMGTYEEGLTIFGVGSQVASFETSPIGQGPSIRSNSPDQIRLPFVGPYSGCFLFGGSINPSVTLPFLNEGVRYVHGGGTEETAQTYPVLNRSGNSFRYIGAIDPLDPVNAHRSAEQLASGKLRTLLAPAGPGEEQLLLESFLRTATNKTIRLAPLGGGDAERGPAEGSGSLVFLHTEPAVGTGSAAYLTPAGEFAAAVENGPADTDGTALTNNLLCGLFGLETMSFRAYSSSAPFDRLRFITRQPAFAPVFPFQKASLNAPSGTGDRLTDQHLTSWAILVNGEAGDVRYMAQPESSPLYSSKGQSAVGGVVVLKTFDPSTRLVAKPGFAVPLAPYAGLAASGDGFEPEDVSLFESQIIAPTRKKLIAALVEEELTSLKQARLTGLRSGITADTTSTTTPQGLLAEVASGAVGSDYVKVTLARSDAPAGRAPEMAFLNLQLPLQNLLQTNQLFSVAVNPKYLGNLQQGAFSTDAAQASFENTVTIAGWTMAAAVGVGVSATDYRNVLIFKFGEGTVQERVASPRKWIGADNFSLIENPGDAALAVTGLSQWLQNYIQDALDEANVRQNKLYANFARIVTDPHWNGILVLRANVDPTGFPEQIAGLAAGIDFTRFEAHHFGVTVSRVQVNGDSISIAGTSSLFGLIDYQLPLFQQSVVSGGSPDVPLGIPIEGEYGFTVLQLQALFQNAALVDFRSRVQLTINDLFDSPVTQTIGDSGPLTANGVVLKGSYQLQGTTASYVFESERNTIFLLASNVFQAIALDRVQFNTLTSDSGGSQPMIRSRFLIWGIFNFTRLPDNQNPPESFDVLSFGTPPDTEPAERAEGLAFSNLQIQLESPVDAPNAVSFSFDPTGLGFDLGGSTARERSLFESFALQLDSFITSPGGKRPADFGYLPVRVKVPLTELDGPWFGVVYKLTMGTPGALVSNAGFESKLLLAWSPQTRPSDPNFSVFTGIQLPGANPGAKLISLQGVLKVSIDSIQLLYETVQGSSPPVKAFNLKLNNIGLKFLGIAKLPPGASINFFLFGDPGGTGSLGWYAAFKKENSGEQLLQLDEPGGAGLLEASQEQVQDRGSA